MMTLLLTKDEMVGDVFDILMAIGDFTEFKAMMLAHRKGRDISLVAASAEKRGEGDTTTSGLRARQLDVSVGRAAPPIETSPTRREEREQMHTHERK